MVHLIRQRAIDGLKQGDVFVYKRAFTEQETLEFGNMTRDYNPVHYNESWTREKGFKGRICHGLLVGSMICEFGGQVGWLATGMTFNFIRPVYFEDTIQCAITITKIGPGSRAEAEAVFTNQEKKQVGKAHMTGRLPMKNEKKILAELVKEGDLANTVSSTPYVLTTNRSSVEQGSP